MFIVSKYALFFLYFTKRCTSHIHKNIVNAVLEKKVGYSVSKNIKEIAFIAFVGNNLFQ